MNECQCCREKKADVRLRIDPYKQELYDKIVMVMICDECEQEYKNEI